MKALQIDESLEMPEETASIEIVVYDYTGQEVGSIDSVTPDELTSVETQTTLLPESPTLLQNYPNPFNPVTRIDYVISERGHVELSIFNLNGQRVKTLVNQDQSAGSHSVLFDGSNLGSGIYLCKMQTENTNITQRMLLMK